MFLGPLPHNDSAKCKQIVQKVPTAKNGPETIRHREDDLLDGSTDLHRSGLLAFRWRHIDFQLMEANVTHSTWHNVEGDIKTEASRKTV